MIARDLMTAAPFAVRESDPVRRAAGLMLEHDVGFIPVLAEGKSGKLVGIVTDRDIAIRYVAKGLAADSYVSAVMTRAPLATVRPESPAEEVIQLMERARVRRLPVTSADDQLVGVIALADVVRGLGRKEPGTIEEILEQVSEATRALV